MSDRVTTNEVKRALKVRCAPPEWAIFYEVANGTGMNIRRYADAVAINLFPSRGLEVHGFEVKVSKSDWRRELADPHKAEAIFKFCDRWWIAAARGVVDKAELPSTWGLLELQADGKLRQVVAAPRLTPTPMDRNFIAGLLRRAGEMDDNVIKEMVDRAVTEARERAEARLEAEVERRTERYRAKIERVEAIEKKLGCDLTGYGAHENIGSILKAIDRLGVEGAYSAVKHHVESMQHILARAAEEVQKFQSQINNTPTTSETAE